MIDFKSFLFILFFALAQITSFGQNDGLLSRELASDTVKLKPRQLKKLAKLATNYSDYYSAIDYYKKYLELKPDESDYIYKIAGLYLRARDYGKALEFYTNVYEVDADRYPMALFYMGQMEIMFNADYEKANENFKDFKKKHKGAAGDKIIRKMLKTAFQSYELSKKLLEDPKQVLIENLDTSINKAHMEFSPIAFDDSTLIFASLRTDSIEYYSVDKEEKDNYADTPKVRKFYVATPNGDNWKYKGELEGPFNAVGINTGNGVFSTDKSRFYFTRCETNSENKTICHIFLSTKDSTGNWNEPKKLEYGINQDNYSSTQPTLGVESKKGYEVLYYISNRPDGKGGYDLWYTIYNEKKEEYKKPKNMGTKMNTVGNEFTPNYDQTTRTMYLSSDGWPGLGGFDIFKFVGEVKKWSKPENIGSPINSNVDDLYYTVTSKKDKGFFVSNRKGGVALKNETCCDDLYQFTLLEFLDITLKGLVLEKKEEKKNIFGQEVNSISTNAVNSSDSLKLSTVEDTVMAITAHKKEKTTTISDAIITLFLIDEETGESIKLTSTTTNAKGYYEIKLEQGNNYKVELEKEGYFGNKFSISTKDITKSDTLFAEKMHLTLIPENPIIIKNIYYPYDKSHLTDASKAVIDTTLYTLLMESADIIIEISSHTDSKGSDKYNEKLSQKRAESVVKYLISKGIKVERLKAKGYGESKPLVPNTNEDGSDNEKNRAKNRRTDFKIIGKIDRYSDIFYEE